MTKKTKKPWGGRFRSELHPSVQAYSRSLHLDRRLAPYDIRGSRAHARMLAAQGIISEEDKALILKGLEQIEREIESGEFPFREELEDIHMNIESRLAELVGPAGSRLHSGRSRNDQVALDVKLFCLDTAASWQHQTTEIIQRLVLRAEQLKTSLFPAWTHLQSAQPLSWGHYLLAFCEMFGRDFRRLKAYRDLHCVSPLGAGALAGSTLPLDPERTAAELGFSSSFVNSYDVVGDRDFVLELVQIGGHLMLHVSRLAEDFIYLSSTPVGWVELPDELCTGSSMMPQKKNPDVLELARGKTAGVLGHATALLALLKGLPTSYQRDLQQDKEHLFAAADVVCETLVVLPLVISGFELKHETTQAALDKGFLMATDLAEYLVTCGVPFRESHEKVGKMVGYCVETGITLEELSLKKMREFAPECGRGVREVLKPQSVLSRRWHRGSTGLASIEQQITHWRKWIEDSK